MLKITAGLAALAAIAIGASSLLHENDAQAQDPSPSAEPVLVELFTSQGCSSCPPADRLAARLAPEPGVVVISRPVTYWDRLGWKDTLARPENTDLQRAYARRTLAGRNGVYTPQTVVDGEFGAVGSQESRLRRQILNASQDQSAVIRVRGDDMRGFAVGINGETEGSAELVLIGVSRFEEVAIGRGENRGERIGYTNVLLGERKVADWTGGKLAHVIEADSLEEMTTATNALDRVLRAEGFWVPQWYKSVHTVAYYDMLQRPENIPPYALGALSFWWYDADRAAELEAAGAF